VLLRTVFENRGGAAGTASWAQEIPAGLEYLPEAGERVPALDERGRLVWEVDVPAPQRGLSAEKSGLSDAPCVVEREIRLQVADSALIDSRGGIRPLILRAFVDGGVLPGQMLHIPCPDITVRVLAERAELLPGALCVMKLQITNRGAAGAPLMLEADIPAGFSDASGKTQANASRVSRRLSWRVDAPPADESGPSVIEVTYLLRADELPRNLERQTVEHNASYMVAEGVPKKAVSAKTEISLPRSLSLVSGDGVLIAVASVLFLGTVAVFLLLLLHKDPSD